MSESIMTRDEVAEWGKATVEKIASGVPAYEKQAAANISDMTKLIVREDGYYREIMQPDQKGPADLMKDWRTSRAVIVCELEPRSPAAMIVPIAGAPNAIYLKCNRYPVAFYRYATWKFEIDVADLLTWSADLRTMVSANSIRDLQAEEDLNFTLAMERCVGNEGDVVATSGIVQNKVITGPLDDAGWIEGRQILGSSPASINPEVCLVNNITIWDLAKLSSFELGDQVKTEITRKGFVYTEWMGTKLVVTIKKGLVKNKTMYWIGEKSFVGRAYYLEDVTMHVERHGHMVSWYATTYSGSAIGNTAGIAKVRYTA